MMMIVSYELLVIRYDACHDDHNDDDDDMLWYAVCSWAEVSLLLRQPIQSEEEMLYTVAAAEAGLMYADQVGLEVIITIIIISIINRHHHQYHHQYYHH